MCERWTGPGGFLNFYTDMGDPPEGHSLDRFPDNDGNYEPGNCRWATAAEQLVNRRGGVPEKMTRKTSISLSDEDDALLHAQLARGDSLREIIRRGLGVERPDVALAREAAAETVAALGDELQDRIDRAVERALRKMQGG